MCILPETLKFRACVSYRGTEEPARAIKFCYICNVQTSYKPLMSLILASLTVPCVCERVWSVRIFFWADF